MTVPLDLQAMVAKMLTEVPKKGTRKKKKKSNHHLQPVATSKSPKVWDDEALVLITTETLCSSCGNTGLSWHSELYVERRSSRTKTPITMLERISNTMYAPAYGHLPKRVEVRTEHTPACPLCFGIGDNAGNAIIGTYVPVQLQLTLTTGE